MTSAPQSIADSSPEVNTPQSEAVRDAELVGEFLRLSEDHWRHEANKALKDGSMDGAMQYHRYAEVLAKAGNKVTAFNGQGEPWERYPNVTLAQTAESLRERTQKEEGPDDR